MIGYLHSRCSVTGIESAVDARSAASTADMNMRRGGGPGGQESRDAEKEHRQHRQPGHRHTGRPQHPPTEGQQDAGNRLGAGGHGAFSLPRLEHGARTCGGGPASAADAVNRGLPPRPRPAETAWSAARAGRFPPCRRPRRHKRGSGSRDGNGAATNFARNCFSNYVQAPERSV